MKRIGALLGLACIFFSCSLDQTTKPRPEPVSNGWIAIDGRMVFYSEENEGLGGYLYGTFDPLLTGTGNISVDVNQVQGNQDMKFGLHYRNPDVWGQQFDFCIRKDGAYLIGWVDDSGANGVNAEYHETGWTGSPAVVQGLNAENTLDIAYDTGNRTFVFSINGTQVFQRAFEHVASGCLFFYCHPGTDASPAAPYRFEFRVTSPFTRP